MTAGRPCEYRDEYLKTALSYLKEYEKHNDAFPMLCGLADIIGCDEDTLSNWGNSKCEEHETHAEFFGAIQRLKNSQKRTVLNKTAKSEINTQLGIRVLSANHGMAEKSEQKQENTGTITIVTKVPERNGGSDSV